MLWMSIPPPSISFLTSIYLLKPYTIYLLKPPYTCIHLSPVRLCPTPTYLPTFITTISFKKGSISKLCLSVFSNAAVWVTPALSVFFLWIRLGVYHKIKIVIPGEVVDIVTICVWDPFVSALELVIINVTYSDIMSK